MLISYKWLQTYFDKPLPEPSVLADILTMGIFEIEGVSEVSSSGAIGIVGATGEAGGANDFKDTILDIKVLPDRASYCLSHRYVAQEVGALIGQPVKFPEIKAEEGNVQKIADKNVSALNIKLENKSGENTEPVQCKRYMGRFVQNVSVDASPAWLKGQLEVLGQRSINSIVDLTNYVMLETGQPLHAFDADKVEGDIVVRNALSGEEITLLDGTVLKLETSMLVIADSVAPIALAGVKGGKKAEVTSATKNIILESACFDSTSTRKTAQKVGIRNESSKRFENGVTPERAELAMTSLCAHISVLNPNALFGQVVDVRASGYEVGSTAFERRDIKVSVVKICERLGVQISKDEIVKILTSLDLPVAGDISDSGAVNEGADILNISIPVYRPDILITEDIVDEVGRVYGYGKIKGVVPKAEGERRINKNFYYHNIIRKTLLELGFSEVYTYTLTDSGDVVIQNPLTIERGFMRSDISTLLSKKFLPNIKNADLIDAQGAGNIAEVRMFEIGKIFGRGPDKERYSLAFGIARSKQLKGVDAKTELGDIVKKVLENIGGENISQNYLYKTLEGDAQTLCTGLVVEFDLDDIIATLPNPKEDTEMSALPQTKFKHISEYPFSSRDIAVFVPDEAGKAGQESEVLQTIYSALGYGVEGASADKGSEGEVKKLLVRSTLFDVFTKQAKNDGEITKTSYAYRLVFQAEDRTLTEGEVNGFIESVAEAFKVKGWEVR